MAEDNGEEKLIAVARHIAKTLGRSDTMTDDILQIFSTFDGRFSREKLSDSSEDVDRLPFSPIEQTLRSIDCQISKFASSDRPIWSDSDSAAEFLAAVDALLAAIRDLDSPLLERADDLLQQSMLLLENELRSLLDGSPLDPMPAAPPFDSDDEEDTDADDQIPVANPVTNYDIIVDAIPPGTVADLHEIAKRMAAGGFGRELAHAYSLSRRDFLAESLSRLGLRPKSTDELRSTPWPHLDDEISRWTRAADLSFRVLLPSERRLADRVFSGLAAVADLSFTESVRAAAVQLLSFADAIATGGRSPERLFRTLDVYEVLRDILPDLDPLFSDHYSAFLRSETLSIYTRLKSAIRGIFTELENLIRRDPAKAPVPGGGLHPITRYVMNYLRAACVSRKTLEEVMEEDGSGADGPSIDLDRPSSSSLTVQIAWILEVLQGNLENKSKIYKDPSLSLIFLANNGNYILQKMRDSELTALMGEEWIRRQRARVKRWTADYQRATWSKVVAVVRTDGVNGATTAGRERARVFNGYLDEIWREQGKWTVVDGRVREELRRSIGEMVVPVYRNFLGRSGERNVKYSVEDVKGMIGELFEGGERRL